MGLNICYSSVPFYGEPLVVSCERTVRALRGPGKIYRHGFQPEVGLPLFIVLMQTGHTLLRIMAIRPEFSAITHYNLAGQLGAFFRIPVVKKLVDKIQI